MTVSHFVPAQKLVEYTDTSMLSTPGDLEDQLENKCLKDKQKEAKSTGSMN